MKILIVITSQFTKAKAICGEEGKQNGNRLG